MSKISATAKSRPTATPTEADDFLPLNVALERLPTLAELDAALASMLSSLSGLFGTPYAYDAPEGTEIMRENAGEQEAGYEETCELTGIPFVIGPDGTRTVVVDNCLTTPVHPKLAHGGPALVAEAERVHVAQKLSFEFWGDLGILRWKVGQALNLAATARLDDEARTTNDGGE